MLVVPLFTSFTRPFLPFSASWMTLSSFLPSLLWIALSASGAVAVMSSAESVLLMETLPPPMAGASLVPVAVMVPPVIVILLELLLSLPPMPAPVS